MPPKFRFGAWAASCSLKELKYYEKHEPGFEVDSLLLVAASCSACRPRSLSTFFYLANHKQFDLDETWRNEHEIDNICSKIFFLSREDRHDLAKHNGFLLSILLKSRLTEHHSLMAEGCMAQADYMYFEPPADEILFTCLLKGGKAVGILQDT